jgi:cell division septation protein DedD
MKSKERHKLQHNVLADWIGMSIESAKPYQNSILVVSLLMLLGVTAYFAWTRMSSASTTQAWTEVNAALGTADVAKLADVITGYPKTNAAYMAAKVLGDSQLAKGCSDLFVDKAIGNPELSKAIDNYSIVLAGSRISSLREQATFGLAQAREAQGELEPAAELYKQITTEWHDGAFAEAAAHRLEYLQQPNTKKFFDRFRDFNPRPAISSETGAGGEKPGAGPGSLPGEPPTAPPTSVKDLRLEGGKGSPPAPVAKPSSEEEAAARKAATEKAAAEKSTTEKASAKDAAHAAAPESKPSESKSPAKAGK